MPLKAYRDSQVIIAPLLSSVQWEQLRAEVKAGTVVLRMPCCDAGCYPRVSKLGTRHFVHRPGGHCGAEGETLDHLLAKSQAALGGQDAGYTVETEAQGEGWRADVLAVRGEARIAIEIQWSMQTLEETELRQERYAADGVRCVWLFRKLPRGARPRRDVPMFALGGSERTCPMVEGKSLREFVAELLRGHYKFCDVARALPTQSVRIEIASCRCWRCHEPCHFFRVARNDEGLQTMHGWPCAYWQEVFPEGLEYSRQVQEALTRFRESEAGKSVLLGKVKERYSRTVGESYMSQGCPFCDALFGEWHLKMEPDSWEAPCVASLDIAIELPRSVIAQYPHWCYSPTKDFCN